MIKKARPKPVLMPELCKGCGRCIEACYRGCITLGTEINQESGLVPVIVDFDTCNGCGLCLTACPEPYGLTVEGYELEDPMHMYGARDVNYHPAPTIPDTRIPMPPRQPVVLKGNYAVAVGALLAGCRHVFGYPITPSTEGAELMASLLPKLDGTFLQAVSEVATINHLYGCGGAGLPNMTFTSSPGFSLMLEGISYMIGAEVPTVILNAMRGGPGLGNIAPEQSDIKLMCRGLGHGNTHTIVLAPSTPQEMLDLTMEAFRLSFEYRTPVIIAADGYLGQMTGKVDLPDYMIKPGMPDWAVCGDAGHRQNLINSIYLSETDLEDHNIRLNEKYARMTAKEQRSTTYKTDDARVLIMACNTPARMAKGAVEILRGEGHPVGLFNPISLWPFPIDALETHLGHVEDILMVESGSGQLEDELRLALSHRGIHDVNIHHLRRMGGNVPQETEIADKARSLFQEVLS